LLKAYEIEEEKLFGAILSFALVLGLPIDFK
jgi:hypothetical protein